RRSSDLDVKANADVAWLAPIGTRACARDRGIDAYDRTVEVDKRTTRVARVDRGVGLHRQIDGIVVIAGTHRPARVGHDATCHRLREPERRACGNHRLTHNEFA